MMTIRRVLNAIRGRKHPQRQRFGPEAEDYVLGKAYVPEHIVSLMALISGAEPFLLEDYLGFVGDNWLILVGYPLETQFSRPRSEQIVRQAVNTYRPEILWFIGPDIPPWLLAHSRTRASDQYYRLDLAKARVQSSLRRVVRKAAEQLAVEQTQRFTPEHQTLVNEFKQRQPLPPMVEALYSAMPAYVGRSKTAFLLNARDRHGSLTAFYVVEPAASTFDTYVLGCYSKTNYVPHASDLLFWEMVNHARNRGKPFINLGLGVNPGIRRFKQKWGGIPFLAYEFCEGYFGPSPARSLIQHLLEGSR